MIMSGNGLVSISNDRGKRLDPGFFYVRVAGPDTVADSRCVFYYAGNNPDTIVSQTIMYKDLRRCFYSSGRRFDKMLDQLNAGYRSEIDEIDVHDETGESLLKELSDPASGSIVKKESGKAVKYMVNLALIDNRKFVQGKRIDGK